MTSGGLPDLQVINLSISSASICCEEAGRESIYVSGCSLSHFYPGVICNQGLVIDLNVLFKKIFFFSK